MPAAKYNFSIDQGATFSQKFTFRDGAGALIDLTGDTFRAQMRSNASSSTVAATFTMVVQNQTTNKGEVVMSLTASETAAIVTGAQGDPKKSVTKFAYDIERVRADASVERMVEGVVSVSPEVTR